MIGIILAGGYATRLKPLTDNTPKHLLEVGGEPMINHLMKDLVKLDVDHYYLVTNDKFYQNFLDWVKASEWSEKITIVNDGTRSNDDRLGSLGDIVYAVNQFDIDDDLFIAGADNLTDFKYEELLDKYLATGQPVLGAYDVGSKDLAKHFGQITINDAGKILEFKEKDPNPNTTLISTLFYVLPQRATSVIQHCCDTGRSDKAGNLIESLLNTEDVYAVTHKGMWFDIGTPETLAAARKHFDKN